MAIRKRREEENSAACSRLDLDSSTSSSLLTLLLVFLEHFRPESHGNSPYLLQCKIHTQTSRTEDIALAPKVQPEFRLFLNCCSPNFLTTLTIYAPCMELNERCRSAHFLLCLLFVVLLRLVHFSCRPGVHCGAQTRAFVPQSSLRSQGLPPKLMVVLGSSSDPYGTT